MTAREPKQEKSPDEIDLLLPWHALEKLSPEEAERVEAALRADPERARHLDLAREERSETVALNQSLGLPSRTARDALFARIEAEGRKPAGGVSQRWRDWLAGLSPHVLAWAGVAAALVITLQAGFLAKAYLGEEPRGYSTASAPNSIPSPAPNDIFVLVAFSPTATAERIDALLRDAHVTIVDGPLPGGVYRVRIGDRRPDAKTVAATIERLKTETGLVRLVAPMPPPAETGP